MLILKEDEYYQVEDFCSFFRDYNKALSTIDELVKQGYLEKIELQRNRKGFTLVSVSFNEKFDEPAPVIFYLVRKEIGIVI
jgi:hypothetical protein